MAEIEPVLRISPQVEQLALLEMQMPTRLRGDFMDYQASPNWNQSLILPSRTEETADQTAMRLKSQKTNFEKMEGRVDKRWLDWAYELYDRAKEIYGKLSEPEKIQLAVFRMKKRLLFENLTFSYRPIMKALSEGRMLGIEKRTDSGDISWRIVSEHTLVAMKAGQVLARSMKDQLLAEKVKRENISTETLNANRELLAEQVVNEVVVGIGLQDVRKRDEIEFKGKQPEKQISLIEELVQRGYGTQEDIKKVKQNPVLAAVTYERLLHLALETRYRSELAPILAAYGNMETIIACSKFAGMPVVDILANGHQPTLAERIANFADKFVQDTGLVSSLEQRHQTIALSYSPRRKVDDEYKYAEQCAREFSAIMRPLPDSSQQIPQYVMKEIYQEIMWQ